MEYHEQIAALAFQDEMEKIADVGIPLAMLGTGMLGGAGAGALARSIGKARPTWLGRLLGAGGLESAGGIGALMGGLGGAYSPPLAALLAGATALSPEGLVERLLYRQPQRLAGGVVGLGGGTLAKLMRLLPMIGGV